MNTPSHMLIGAAIFARPLEPKTLIAALAGGLVPDLPMFAMILWATRVAKVPENEVFGRLFFSDEWQAVFAVDHGFLVWGALLAGAVWLRSLTLRAFAGSGLLHAAADFLTHRDDARRQFWPVSDWIFRSPVSYWDARYYGDVFGLFEVGLVVALTALLCWRLRRWRERALVLAVAAPILVPVLLTGGLHGLHGMG
ncbi:MAG: cobalamin biosynthesis protein CobQ [Pseudomonadota bacterium]